MIGLKKGTVKIVPYRKEWATLFEKEKKRLEKALGNKVVDIQHVGSTSIPNMSAKPIIDINIGIKMMRDSIKFIKLFKSLGYEYNPKFGNKRTHIVFSKGSQVSTTHFLHLMRYNGNIWKQHLSFRNYLCKHKSDAKKYEQLKKSLQKKFANDKSRHNYIINKARFIKNIIKKASK